MLVEEGMTAGGVKKIEKVFKEKYLRGVCERTIDWIKWRRYLKGLGCILVTADDGHVRFREVWNSSPLSICIEDPAYAQNSIVVPREVLDKILVLGDLP